MARSMMLVTGLASLLFAACSSHTAAPPDGASGNPLVADVGSVTVDLSSSLDADNRKILDEVNGARRLETAVEWQLGNAGKLRPGSPRVLEIHVEHLRLRSGTTVILLGIMSGLDTLQVHCTVREHGRVVREYDSGDSTSGGFGGISSSSRFQMMVDASAERIGGQL